MKKILLLLLIISINISASEFENELNLKKFPINSYIIGTIDIKEFSKAKEFSKIFYTLQKELNRNNLNIHLSNLSSAYFFKYFSFLRISSAIVFENFKIPDISKKRIKIGRKRFYFIKKMYYFSPVFKDKQKWRGYAVYENESIIGAYHLILDFLKIKLSQGYSILGTKSGKKLDSLLSKVNGTDIRCSAILNDYQKVRLAKRYKKRVGTTLWNLLVDNFRGFAIGGKISNNKMIFLLLLLPNSNRKLEKVTPIIKNLLNHLQLLNGLFNTLNIRDKTIIQDILKSIKLIDNNQYIVLSFSVKNRVLVKLLTKYLHL